MCHLTQLGQMQEQSDIVDSGSNPKTSLLGDVKIGANFASQQFRIASSGETSIDSPAAAAGSRDIFH